MPELVEKAHKGEFILSEASGTRSREEIVVAASQNLAVGQILGQVTGGALAAVAAAVAGNTGNGAMSAVTADAGVAEGEWKVVIVEPAANAGAFTVEDPAGVTVGHGTVGVAYNGPINFTLGDGAVDFVAGDMFTVTVTAAVAADEGQYKALNLAATDGTQVPAAILEDAVSTGVGETKPAVAIAREAEVNGQLIVYPAGATDNQKAAIRDGLAKLGVIVRQ